MLVTRHLTELRQATIPVYDPGQRSIVTMEDLIAGVDAPRTDLEEALYFQFGMKEAPFAGMDKSGRGVCLKHQQGKCPFGQVSNSSLFTYWTLDMSATASCWRENGSMQTLAAWFV